MKAIDLFAGMGGFTLGATQAGMTVVWAANHWKEAVYVHSLNHPATHHECQDLKQADWTKVPKHNVLCASPSCQGHSPARGKEKPHHDGERASAFAVVDCAECHRPEVLVVENVPAFARWELYPSWVDALRRLGYALSAQVLDAADHGVPQNRKRIFVVGVRGKTSLWLTGKRYPHQPASSFIKDSAKWSMVAQLCPRTQARVARGYDEFGENFLVPYYSSGSGLTGRSLDRPIGTITTKDRWALVNLDKLRMLSAPEYRDAMGFPENYRLPEDHATAVHMLGNAVPPPMAADILMEIKQRV